MEYEIIKDNIVNLKDYVDAIVNSSNPFISMGGGVCGAIHKAAGFEFTKYCINLGGLTTMQSKISPGFNLPYKYVIHSLAPMYNKSKNPKEELINTYLNAINTRSRVYTKYSFSYIRCWSFWISIRYSYRLCIKFI